MARFLDRLAASFPYRVLRDRDQVEAYLVRYRILRVPLLDWDVYLHRICREDSTQDFHDHPWPFLQVIIAGGYVEETRSGFLTPGWRQGRELRPGTIRWRRATFAHRVGRLLAAESWSLVVAGRRWRSWGFIRWVDGQWVPWRTYLGLDQGEADEYLHWTRTA